MKSRDIEVPFVRGQDTSGSPKAYSEPGKFRRVHNLCIQPAHADALSVRRSATAIVEVGDDGQRKLVNCEDAVSLVLPDSIRNLNAADSAWTQTSKVRNVDLISSKPVEFSGTVKKFIAGAAFVRDSVGDEAVILTTKDPLAGTDVEILTQVTVGGQARDMTVLTTAPSAGSAQEQAVFLFAGDTTDRLLAVTARQDVTEIRVYRYSKASATWTLITTIAGCLSLLDAEKVNAGIILAFNGATRLRAALLNLDGTLSWNVQVNGVQTNPTIAACCQVATSTTVHIWSGGYTADANTIRAFRIDTTTQAVTTGGTSVAFGAAVLHMTACARAQLDRSWCYVAGPKDGKGALFLTSDNMATISLFGDMPRFEPLVKIWGPPAYASSSDPRPYLLGTLGTQIGIWQLSTSILPSSVLIYSGTRGAYRNLGTFFSETQQRGHTLYVNGDAGKAVVITSTGPEVIEWGFRTPRPNTTQHAGFTFLPSGHPRYYDGSKWVPMGFFQPPAATLATSAVGSLSAGVYTYALVWEWTDTRGRRHQSPAALYTVTSAGGVKCDFTVFAWSVPVDERLMDASGRVRVVAYRTKVGGATLTRAVTFELSAAPFASATITFSDTLSDDQIAPNEILYTTQFGSNELQAFGIEGCDLAVGYSDRIVYHTPAFPAKLFYSKSLRDARPFECNAALSFFVPAPVTGIAAQDGNLYAFTEDNVYSLVPQFANDDGTGATAVDPIPLSPDVGLPAEYYLSLINTPEGLFFRGRRGFFMIPRGGGVPVYVGLPLEGNLLSSVSGAAHNAATSEICWVTSSGGVQQVVVFNYLYKQWFTWEFYSGDNLSLEAGVVARRSNGYLYFGDKSAANSPWTLIRQDGANSLDAGPDDRDVQVVIETADFDINDIGHRTRVTNATVEAEWSSAVLAIEESHDQGSSYTNTVSYSAATEPLVYQVATRKTQGIRFRLRSTAATAGMRLYGMTIKCKTLAKAVTSSGSRKG